MARLTVGNDVGGTFTDFVAHDRAFASEGGTHLNFVFGGQDRANDECFACYDIEVVGWGRHRMRTAMTQRTPSMAIAG